MIYIYYSGRHRCGSGVVSKFAADLYPSSHVFSTDVNPTAISSTRATMDIVASASHLLFSDLFSAFFKPRPLFDVIIFNPPYVPTDADEYARSLRDRDISASWAGGNNGREVTDRFLRDCAHHLVPEGVVYLVVIDLNDVPSTLEYASRYGLKGEIYRERKAGIEKLYVLRFFRILE